MLPLFVSVRILTIIATIWCQSTASPLNIEMSVSPGISRTEVERILNDQTTTTVGGRDRNVKVCYYIKSRLVVTYDNNDNVVDVSKMIRVK